MESFKEIETKWQKFWEEHPELYHAQDDETDKKKKYVLVEFPYPSGSGLHIGHAFSFTGADVFARFNRMQGLNVLFPMGWDAFGLPTENYAIKTKQKPQKVTKDNTDKFRSQMKELAFSFDWAREVNTTDPKYYKWTQWIFIQLFKKGLAYKKEMPINWCPSCKIGLANEEVINGRCERCGAEVERRTIAQWVLKITEYADRLIKDLDLTDFPNRVKQSQTNWIGKSEGAKIRFKIKDSDQELEVFTTRPDTLFGATFMVVAPEHKIVSDIIAGDEIFSYSRPASDVKSDSDDSVRKNSSLRNIDQERLNEIKNYVENARKKSDLERTELNKEKTGVFSGLYATNPANGKEMPIWISDFVLSSYGTGAIMSVPAHDERDFAFAKKFGLPIQPVIEPEGGWNFEEKPYTDVDNGVIVNSEPINGLTPEAAFEKMVSWLQEKGIGEKTASYHLRDWIFSRQHYWGEPIPMIYCEEHGWQPVPEDQLPVVLPDVEFYEPTDTGESPLSTISNWVDTVCPICGKPARRETDTMPNWAGSDWYYVRYTDPNNDTVLASPEKLKYWMPVDIYVGGDEHTTLHLLYSRFIYKFLYDIGTVPTSEPYFKRVPHGVILGPDNQRMSKSRGNVIIPEVVAGNYGVDVVRMYLMFMGPFDATMAWNENTLMGVKRFADRFSNWIEKQIEANKQNKNSIVSSKDVLLIINKLIKGVSEDLSNFKFNTAIAKTMEALNDLSVLPGYVTQNDIKTLIKLIAPFTPYLSEELWSQVRSENDSISVHKANWPVADEKYLIEETIKVAVAVNGKVRDEIEISQNIKDNQTEVLKIAKETEKVQNWIGGKEVVKEIYVPGKMVNLVIKA
jgi:leucyl-tRNA synthetase